MLLPSFIWGVPSPAVRGRRRTWRSLRRPSRTAYFQSRPAGGHQLSAWASAQTRRLRQPGGAPARRMEELTAQYQDREVHPSAVLGRYLLRATTVELWAQGADRLHDRRSPTSFTPGPWTAQRLRTLGPHSTGSNSAASLRVEVPLDGTPRCWSAPPWNPNGPRVLIVGGGFAGLSAARAPQAAHRSTWLVIGPRGTITSSSRSSIKWPWRRCPQTERLRPDPVSILARHENTQVVLAEGHRDSISRRAQAHAQVWSGRAV